MNMHAASDRVFALSLGPAASIPLHNTLVFSCAAWLAGLIPPNEEVLKCEYKLRQKLLRAPWRAIPSPFLPGLKAACNFKFEVGDLRILSNAAKTRTAVLTSNKFDTELRALKQSLLSMERVLAIPQREWLNNSVLMSIDSAVTSVTKIAPDIMRKFNRSDSDSRRLFSLQHKLYKHLHERGDFISLEDLLCKRWLALLPEGHPSTSKIASRVYVMVRLFKNKTMT